MRAGARAARSAAAAALVLVMGAGSALAAAAKTTLRVHHLLPPSSAVHRLFLVPWCAKIEAESGGTLGCQVFPSMQLGGSAPQLYDQVRDGVVDVVWTLPGYTAGRFAGVEVFELPFTMRSVEATSRALWEYIETHDADEWKDVHLLGVHTHGPGVLHSREKPIRALEDFAGLKIRAASRMTGKLLSALGATPVALPITRLPEALSRGVIDATLLPWEVVPTVKAQELTAFHTETDPSLPALYTQVIVFAMNKARYASLPLEQKRVLDANSGIELSAKLGRVLLDADGPGREAAAKHGNQFYTVPAAELARWRAAAERVEREWLQEGGEAERRQRLLAAARQLIEKHSGK